MHKLFKWLDDNLLTVLTSFLLIFIPLFPKLPLVDALPGYIVRIRLEDLLISFIILVWFVYVLRKKITLGQNPLLKPILFYLGFGLLSMISAIFLIQTVPFESLHINKMILHFLRRVEYFSLFFIFYSSVKNTRQAKFYLGVLIVTVIGVVIYGFGQKYLYWPAFSTMNREFSKGWMLYLTKHARVLSTFGGHYDLAAFIMMALILLWSLFFAVRRWFIKILLLLLIAGSFWTLILTASRTSFLAYLFGLTLTFFFWAFRKGLRWSIPRWFIVTALSIVIMLSFGDLSERFTKLLRINERLSVIKLFLFSPIGAPPTDRALFLENNAEALAAITSKSDQPPKTSRPSDVEQDIPLPMPGTESGTIINAKRTYSRTAFLFDLSTAIRFDALWPMALKGFYRNPVLGSGYSTLNKKNLTDFTEAESTDNDYLRALGETGLLGFISFYGALIIVFWYIWKNLRALQDPILFSLSVGLAGLLSGLLVNAVYIDVFESSKVAFSFWAMTGFVLATINAAVKKSPTPLSYPIIPDWNEVKKKGLLRFIKFLRSDVFFLLIILLVALSVRLYKINTPLADWHSWRQADTSSVTRHYVKNGINVLYPTYDDLSNVASGKDNSKGLRFVEFPLYNAAAVIIDKIFVGFNIEVSGRLTSIFATLGSITFLFLLVRKYLSRFEAAIAGLLYAIIPFNIYFTRVILPEPFQVFLSLGMIYFFDKFISKSLFLRKPTMGSPLKNKIKLVLDFVLAFFFTLSALLVKPFSAFLFLPMIYLWLKGFGWSIKSIIGLIAYFGISSLPLLLWRLWINNFPEGVPAFMWLFNGDGIRFKGAFFFWIFADRLVRMILGYWGLPLLILGIIAPLKKEGMFLRWWGVAILTYVIVVATGNVRHDYYQTMTIPIVVIFMAKGFTSFLEITKKTGSAIAGYIVLLVLIVFTEMFGWYHIRDLYNINHPEIVEAGRAVERKTSDKALVIAPYNGDTAFLYQTRRSGWPIFQDSLEQLIKKGAQYYVSVNFDDLTKQLIKEATLEDETKRKYKLIELTDKYVIVQLVPDKQLPR